MSTVASLFAEAAQLDDAGLEKLTHLLLGERKVRLTRSARQGLAEYRVGDLVAMDHDCKMLLKGTVGKVLKVNQVRMKIDFGRFGRWNAYPSMVKPLAGKAVVGELVSIGGGE